MLSRGKVHLNVDQIKGKTRFSSTFSQKFPEQEKIKRPMLTDFAVFANSVNIAFFARRIGNIAERDAAFLAENHTAISQQFLFAFTSPVIGRKNCDLQIFPPPENTNTESVRTLCK